MTDDDIYYLLRLNCVVIAHVQVQGNEMLYYVLVVGRSVCNAPTRGSEEDCKIQNVQLNIVIFKYIKKKKKM